MTDLLTMVKNWGSIIRKHKLLSFSLVHAVSFSAGLKRNFSMLAAWRLKNLQKRLFMRTIERILIGVILTKKFFD